jgi:hypothetical protein
MGFLPCFSLTNTQIDSPVAESLTGQSARRLPESLLLLKHWPYFNLLISLNGILLLACKTAEFALQSGLED